MKTLKKIELTTPQKKALIDSWNDILSGKKGDYSYILLQVLKQEPLLRWIEVGEEIQRFIEVGEEIQRFIKESARIRDLIQKDPSLKYHSLEAYCHDVTVAIKSFLHVDAVTLNIRKVRDGEGEYGELIPHGWSAGETNTFIIKRIRIKKGSNLNLAGELYGNTKHINIPDYRKVKEDRFEFKKFP